MAMGIIIKPMETDKEIRGKAFVHWKCWQVTYPGLVSQAYLEKFTLEVSEERAKAWRDNILVAKDGDSFYLFSLLFRIKAQFWLDCRFIHC